MLFERNGRPERIEVTSGRRKRILSLEDVRTFVVVHGNRPPHIKLMKDKSGFLVRSGAGQSAPQGIGVLMEAVRKPPSRPNATELSGKTPLTVSVEAMYEAGLTAGQTAMAETLAAGVPVTVFENGKVVVPTPPTCS